MNDDVTRERLDDLTECPARSDLVAFHRGHLPVERAEQLGRHLAECPHCLALVRDLTDQSDPATGGLRSSHTQVEPARRRPQTPPGAPATGAASQPESLGTIGPYQLLRRLRGGGMGEVYEARHIHLDRHVALKTLRGDRMHHPPFVERFQREMRAVGKLDHPNIVRASDAGAADGRHFLVMDFIDGRDLAAVVRAVGVLRSADAAEVIRQAALGLQRVHEHGLVHRDVKPSNLMLDETGTVKLLDLGLALLRETNPATPELTEPGLGMGTADYLSPEQAQDAHGVTIASDLYSLGCTLYKLLAGRAPFDEPQYRRPFQKMQAHVRATPPPLQSLRLDVPPALAAVVHRLLAKRPEDRFAEPRDVAEALAPFAADSNLVALLREARACDASPAGAARSTPSPLPQGRRPSRAARLGGVALLVLLSCGAVAAWRSWPVGSSQRPPIDDPALAWPDDLPAVLRDRPPGSKVELIRPTRPSAGPRALAEGNTPNPKVGNDDALTYRPLWFRRLAGSGQFFATPTALVLNANLLNRDRVTFGPEYTALALDDDLALRWFEFEAELWPGQNGAVGGLFFGWRPLDGQHGAYLVQVDAPLAAGDQVVPRRVLVGYRKLPVTDRGAAAGDAPFETLTDDALAEIPIHRPRNRYHVKVQAAPGRITVSVDDEPPVHVGAVFEPRGMLGIWARRGGAWFGRASVVAMPP